MPRYRLRRVKNGALHANRCRCEPIERFRCAGCDRMVGNCLGADDEQFELCDDCWSRSVVVPS